MILNPKYTQRTFNMLLGYLKLDKAPDKVLDLAETLSPTNRGRLATAMDEVFLSNLLTPEQVREFENYQRAHTIPLTREEMDQNWVDIFKEVDAFAKDVLNDEKYPDKEKLSLMFDELTAGAVEMEDILGITARRKQAA